MNNIKTAIQLIQSTKLSLEDIARVALEAREELFTDEVQDTFDIHLLRKIVHLGVDEWKQRKNSVTFKTTALLSLEARKHLRPTSKRDLKYYITRILSASEIGDLPLRSIRASTCRNLLERLFSHSPSSYIKARAVLHSIFAYGVRQEWCETNPIDKVSTPRIREKIKKPLSVTDVSQLLKTAARPRHRPMYFSLCLMLFNGIRPTEVSRINTEDILWADKELHIRPETSKTGGGRVVPLRVSSRGLKREDALIPRNWQQRWRNLRRDAGFQQWVPDVCRHTFASYHAAFFRNYGILQWEMGHRDASLLRTRYVYPTSSASAKRFWQLSKRCEDSNLTEDMSFARLSAPCNRVCSAMRR